jgi:glycosyltransferase involved in cell wall biosynthesis
MPLRLLSVGHSYVVAANRAVMRELASRPELDVTVAAPRAYDGDLRPLRLEPEPDGSPLRVVPIPAWGGRPVHLFRWDGRALRRVVRRGGFDVVHAWEEPYLYAGYQIARSLRGSSCRFCFRTAQNLVKRYPGPVRWMERRVLARSQAWIAGGHLVYRAMLRRGYPAERGRVLPLGVDTSAFRPLSEARREDVRAELGLAPPLIGYLGRLTPEKGIDVLLGALERLPARTWTLALFGSGPMRADVEAWSRRRGWSDRVRIRLLRHEEVPAYLGALDVLVAPSLTTPRWREQFGRMVVEAFASGVPVVTSDSGELPWVVADAGVIVHEGDADRLAAALADVLVDPGRRSDLARRGLQRAELFSARRVADGYQEVFEWAASQRLP